MTTTRWTTTATIPPAAWAAMTADIQALLAVSAAGGATVTGANGNAHPTLTDLTIAFTVTAPKSQPLTVQFQRTPGDGEVVTGAPHTDGLVLAALDRAAYHWGALLTYETDADTTAQAVARQLHTRLFEADDAAVTGITGMGIPSRVGQILSRAQGAATPGEDTTLLDHLDAVIAEIQAERAGIAIAESLQ